MLTRPEEAATEVKTTALPPCTTPVEERACIILRAAQNVYNAVHGEAPRRLDVMQASAVGEGHAEARGEAVPAGYSAVQPPSATSDVPVTRAEASLARNTMAPVRS
jgi:hypothetical protein